MRLSRSNQVNSVLFPFILALLFLAGCENNEKALPTFRKKQISVDEGREIVAYMSEGAKIKARLTAPYMVRSEMDSAFTEFPKSLHVDFFNDSMQIETQLDARYGKWMENISKVYLRDSVIVKNILKGDTLHSIDLWWDQKADKFYTDKAVRIHKKGGTILYGKGLEAPSDFSGYTIMQITGPYGVPNNAIPK